MKKGRQPITENVERQISVLYANIHIVDIFCPQCTSTLVSLLVAFATRPTTAITITATTTTAASHTQENCHQLGYWWKPLLADLFNLLKQQEKAKDPARWEDKKTYFFVFRVSRSNVFLFSTKSCPSFWHSDSSTSVASHRAKILKNLNRKTEARLRARMNMCVPFYGYLLLPLCNAALYFLGTKTKSYKYNVRHRRTNHVKKVKKKVTFLDFSYICTLSLFCAQHDFSPFFANLSQFNIGNHNIVRNVHVCRNQQRESGMGREMTWTKK